MPHTYVRPGTLDDIPWLMTQLQDFATFFGTQRRLFPDDPAHATRLLSSLIREHPFFIACQGPNDDCVGFIAGTLTPHHFNPDIRVLSEVFWWVTPEARGGRAGIMLLQEFIHIGFEQADWIVMTLEHASPVHPETLERRGFRLHERSFLLEV